ncbi:hypothetical protein EB796_008388 [Bugula neritina]|uniref:PARP catalytic domain-containing protein n=1 Tax=Bugula neritina TaxID=10212 RepID=A0A7J7K5S3_BUGNE|nr:hypothetical protein EB796_008388 [Bugula neritina]
MLGACCYFATTSEYSDKWNKEVGPDGEKYMIMARVITGDYGQGHGGLRQAPYKPGSGYIHYDSVVDDVANPTMYGVFNDSSVWPEYVIKYKHISKQRSLQVLGNPLVQVLTASHILQVTADHLLQVPANPPLLLIVGA